MKKYTTKDFDAFVSGSLSPQERKAFEERLSGDPALQKAFFTYAFEPEPMESTNAQKKRAFLQQLMEKNGPLPTPKLSAWDRMVFNIQGSPSWIKLTLPLLFLGLLAIFILKNRNPYPKTAIIEQYFQEAYCPGVAGAEEVAEFFEAASIYCSAEPDATASLRKITENCKDYCLAQYYLAHADLKAGNYGASINNLDASISHLEVLRQIQPNLTSSALQLNKILAQLGQGVPQKELATELNGLAASVDPESALGLEIAELKKFLD